MRFKTWCILFGLSILISCSSSREGEIYQQVKSEDIQFGLVEDDFLAVEISYIGAIGHSFIFECSIENVSSKDITIDKSQFSMEFNETHISSSIEEDDIVDILANNRKDLKKRRKNSTILGGLFIGIGVIAGASSGLNAGEVLSYSADPLIAIFDDRRWYQRNIESVEDEIEYIRSAQFNNYSIPPDSIIIRDLLFPTYKIKTDVDLVLNYEGHEYVITFPRNIF